MVELDTDDLTKKVTECSFEELENYPEYHCGLDFDYRKDCSELLAQNLRSDWLHY